jgi:hypothetical protein
MRLRRFFLGPLLAALFAVGVAAPASASTVAPDRPATVVNSCHISGCAAALDAYHGWSSLGFPTVRGWYRWTNGKYNFAGGQFRNLDGQLPRGDTFWEYDVYPRNRGAHRDAYRIVLDENTGWTWYSPDHYANFYRIV